MAWNPAGTQIATGNLDGTLRLFDAATLAPIGDPVRTGNDDTSAVAWNPAGTQIATGNVDGTMRLFDAATQAPIGDPVRTGNSRHAGGGVEPGRHPDRHRQRRRHAAPVRRRHPGTDR